MGNPTVTIAGITMYGATQRADGVYQVGPKFFQDWYTVPPTKTPLRERPAQDGAFGRDRTYRSALPLTLNGWARGSNWAALMTALAAAVGTGTPIAVTVNDAVGVSVRTVTVTDFVPYPNPGANRFEFDLVLTAEDPNRYGTTQSVSCGAPTSGVGMPWPQAWPVVWGSATVLRTNLSTNPNAVTASGFYPNDVTWTVATNVTAPTGNPQGITKCARSALNGAQTTPYVLSMYNVDTLANAGTARQLGAWFYVNASGYQATLGGAAVALTANTWTWVTGSFAAGSYSLALIGKISGNAGASDVGYITGVTALATGTPAATIAGGIVYPSTAAPDPTLFSRWTAAADASTSELCQLTGTGNAGRATAVNTGARRTPLLLTVAGGLASGVDLVEITTGRHLTLARPIPLGSSAIFDASVGRVYLDQPSNDITGFLTAAEWSGFQIPAAGQSVVQFNPLGVQTGTPMLTLQWAPAN